MANSNSALLDDLSRRGYSRRAFGRISALLGAGAALPFYNEAALAQMSFSGNVPADAVMINANENPLGPCTEALEAMSGILRRGGRYLFGESIQMGELLAEQEGLKAEYVQPYAGSSDPLHRSVLAFASPSRSYVTADPGYEAGERAARSVGAKVVGVPLTATHAHDVREMVKRAPDAGLFFICNPNNPTGTLTPRQDIEWLVANKPAGSVVLIDEAYIHFTDVARCTDMVAAGKDVIVLRTFSKIYGMAGLRAGAAIARPDLLEKLRFFGTFFLPTTAMVGARTSLAVKTLVPERRKYIQDVREETLSYLTGRGYQAVPSVSNKFMLDVKRPGREVIRALAAEKVIVGRVWPSWPNHVRVTVGTKDEMARFKAAFAKVTA